MRNYERIGNGDDNEDGNSECGADDKSVTVFSIGGSSNCNIIVKTSSCSIVRRGISVRAL